MLTIEQLNHIAQLKREGKPNKQIARLMQISLNTVKKYLKDLELINSPVDGQDLTPKKKLVNI